MQPILYTSIANNTHNPRVRCVDDQVEVYAQGVWVPASAITRTPGGLVVVETEYHDGETTIPEVYIIPEAMYEQQLVTHHNMNNS